MAAYAEGRWRCETAVVDGSVRQELTTIVAIGGNGRFTYEVRPAGDGPLAGTWSVEGLELRLSIPWDDDGASGFYDWVYEADADPPTHVSGRRTEGGGAQELDVEVSREQIEIVQHDEPGADGPNYDWDLTCERESSDPGDIPDTVPPSDGD